MVSQEDLKKELFNLSAAARVCLALGVLIALFLDNDYSNLIFGGVAGYLLYPPIEYFIRIVAD